MLVACNPKSRPILSIVCHATVQIIYFLNLLLTIHLCFFNNLGPDHVYYLYKTNLQNVTQAHNSQYRTYEALNIYDNVQLRYEESPNGLHWHILYSA